ncbi:MAG: HEAT repeat domain-containing protein [Methanoregula sp.]|nr:HEAT repeat domain-containing protein [Methanoregula sp.]
MMDDRPRIILKDLVSRYGISLATDPLRTEGLLRDTCGTNHREIFVLVSAVRQKVPADLLAPRHSLSITLLKDFLAKRLRDELSLSEEASHWAVASWADALGVTGNTLIQDPEQEPVRQVRAQCTTVPQDPAFIGRREQWAGELESESLDVRLRAVQDISHTPDPENTRLLISALENGNWQVRNAAFDALSGIGDAAIPALCEALGDTSDEIIWRSSLLLGALRAREAVGLLTQLLGREGIIRECAIWSLGEISDDSVSTALLKFIHAKDPVVQQEAEAALNKIAGAQNRKTS